jgi:phosphatidylserine decarboxylase
VRRRAGWLPQNQDDLASWLARHRKRVDARGGKLVVDPVLIEFQELVDTDSIVRMHLNEMIAQVPKAKQYRKQHLDSVA